VKIEIKNMERLARLFCKLTYWICNGEFVDQKNGIRIKLPNSGWNYYKGEFGFTIFSSIGYSCEFKYLAGRTDDISEIEADILQRFKSLKEEQYPKFEVSIVSTRNVQIGKYSAMEIMYSIDMSKSMKETFFTSEKMQSMPIDRNEFVKRFGSRNLIAVFVVTKQREIYFDQQLKPFEFTSATNVDKTREFLHMLVGNLELF
jgi:hypothetical protein